MWFRWAAFLQISALGTAAACPAVVDCPPAAPTPSGLVAAQVTATIRRTSTELMELATDAGTIVTTPDHRFGTARQGWVRAGDLSIGDRIQTTDRHRLVMILAMTRNRVPQRVVYNLVVERAHAYFVGPGGLLVHNGCGDESDSSSDEGAPRKRKWQAVRGQRLRELEARKQKGADDRTSREEEAKLNQDIALLRKATEEDGRRQELKAAGGRVRLQNDELNVEWLRRQKRRMAQMVRSQRRRKIDLLAAIADETIDGEEMLSRLERLRDQAHQGATEVLDYLDSNIREGIGLDGVTSNRADSIRRTIGELVDLLSESESDLENIGREQVMAAGRELRAAEASGSGTASAVNHFEAALAGSRQAYEQALDHVDRGLATMERMTPGLFDDTIAELRQERATLMQARSAELRQEIAAAEQVTSGVAGGSNGAVVQALGDLRSQLALLERH